MRIDIKIGKVSFSLVEDLKGNDGYGSGYSHITKSDTVHKMFIEGIEKIIKACTEANKTVS